jgi:hypothetical protein
MAPKRGKKKEEPKATLEQLQAVAEDFNSFMKFEEGDEIPTDVEYDELLEEVTEVAGQLEASDTIQAETADTLDALGIEYAATVADDGEAEDEPEPEPEAEAPEIDEELIAKVSKSRKIDDILAVAKTERIAVPPPFRKDIKKLKEYVLNKLNNPTPTQTKAKAEPKAKPAPKAKAPKGYSRPMAFAEVVKTAKTEDDLTIKANQLYVDNGGTDNEKEARWCARIGIQILQQLDLLEIDEGGKVKYNG